MSISFLDPQAPAKLPSLYETLDFTVVDTDPEQLTVSLRYPNGHMETIWQAGIAGRLYTVTRDGTESRTFHVTRIGGWPRGAFDLPMTEAESLPTGGSSWGSIYDLDLTAQPTMTLANGPNTIDGYNWYSKGTTGFVDAVVNNVLNGSGLECGGGAFGVSGNYPYRMPWFPFAQLPDFNPNSPVAVAMRWAGSGLSSSNYMVGGIASMADNGTMFLSTERPSQAFVKYEGDSSQLIHAAGFGSLNPVAITPASATYGDHVFYESRLAGQVYSSGHAAYPGGGVLPVDVNALVSGINPVILTTAQTNLGFFFTRNRSSSFTCYLTHLSVLQPRA